MMVIRPNKEEEDEGEVEGEEGEWVSGRDGGVGVDGGGRDGRSGDSSGVGRSGATSGAEARGEEAIVELRKWNAFMKHSEARYIHIK